MPGGLICNSQLLHIIRHKNSKQTKRHDFECFKTNTNYMYLTLNGLMMWRDSEEAGLNGAQHWPSNLAAPGMVTLLSKFYNELKFGFGAFIVLINTLTSCK